MKHALLPLFALMLCGCSVFDNIGSRYTFWQLDKKNHRNDSVYRQTVAEFAEDETLVGTWTSEYIAYKKSIGPENSRLLSAQTTPTFSAMSEAASFATSTQPPALTLKSSRAYSI